MSSNSFRCESNLDQVQLAKNSSSIFGSRADQPKRFERWQANKKQCTRREWEYSNAGRGKNDSTGGACLLKIQKDKLQNVLWLHSINLISNAEKLVLITRLMNTEPLQINVTISQESANVNTVEGDNTLGKLQGIWKQWWEARATVHTRASTKSQSLAPGSNNTCSKVCHGQGAIITFRPQSDQEWDSHLDPLYLYTQDTKNHQVRHIWLRQSNQQYSNRGKTTKTPTLCLKKILY